MYMPLRSRMCSSASSVLMDFSSYSTLARAMRRFSPLGGRVRDVGVRFKRGVTLARVGSWQLRLRGRHVRVVAEADLREQSRALSSRDRIRLVRGDALREFVQRVTPDAVL